ncbi:MAG TPA: DNA replication/repair protein RecF [Clostridia bacterium]|nr:DNA replication/repair protein RecF [Clostridia bacterium]HHY06065.1 DNA replication/repair protein RecF [Clostridia bacterium]
MYLEKISLTNYRNYESLEINFSEQINLFRGPNAQGKTNLLEAIYYLAIGRAYRPIREDQLIKWGHNHCLLKGEVKNKIGRVNLEVILCDLEQAQKLKRAKKEIKVNGLKIRRMTDFFGNLTAVLFAPENLNIVKGAPSARRKLLDNDISQVSPSYYLQLQKYNQILKQRNFLLKKIRKSGRDYAELEIWDLQLKKVGEKIIQKRLEVLEKLTPLTRLMQRKLTGGRENLEFRYFLNRETEIKKGANLKSIINEEFAKVKEKELERGITLWGPHRDDFLLTVNGINLKLYGSQGQHRTAVLAIKLAELEFFKSESGEYPLLLLDDVLSELDQERREYLLEIILSKAIQCFITTTEDVSSFFKNDDNFTSFYVQNGVLQ